MPCFQYDVVFSLTVCLFLLAVGKVGGGGGGLQEVFFCADFVSFDRELKLCGVDDFFFFHPSP